MTYSEIMTIKNELKAKRDKELAQARKELLEAQAKIELIIQYYNRLAI